MIKTKLDNIIKHFDSGKPFVPEVVELTQLDCQVWVRFRIDPKRFLPSIFNGDWANTTQHPSPGDMRILRAMKGDDGVTRLIARQGRYVYAYPWFN